MERSTKWELVPAHFGPLWSYVQDDAITDIDFNGRDLWITNTAIDAIHSFVIGAQRRGGDAGGSIVLLAKNRAMWAERVMNLQKEFQIVKRNIMIALVATMLICILPLYLLGGDLDISSIPLCQISAVVLIGICMLIYVKADKKLCRSWIEKEVDSTGMGKKYLQVRDYDEVKEAKSSQKMAIIPVILFIGAFIYFKNIAVLVAGVVVVLFFLNQHKIGHSLAIKKVASSFSHRKQVDSETGSRR